jgi:hypothetical protein
MYKYLDWLDKNVNTESLLLFAQALFFFQKLETTAIYISAEVSVSL